MATWQIQTYAFSQATADDYEIVAGISGKKIAVTGVLLGAAGTNTVKFTSSITDEVQTVTVDATEGTYTLTYDGQTTGNIAYDAAASAVATALKALSNIGDDDVTVTGAAGGPYTVSFIGALADTNVPAMTATATGLNPVPSVTVATTQAGSADPAANEIQTVTVANAGGGTFTLTFDGQTTGNIAYNASAATVATALKALSNIGDNDVTVTKAGSVYTVEFVGDLAAANQAEMTASAASLTTSGTSSVTIATVTSGGTKTDLTGAVPTVAGSQIRWQGSASEPLFKTGESSGLSVTLSASNSVAGIVNYVVIDER